MISLSPFDGDKRATQRRNLSWPIFVEDVEAGFDLQTVRCDASRRLKHVVATLALT